MAMRGGPVPLKQEVPKYLENRWDSHHQTIYILFLCQVASDGMYVMTYMMVMTPLNRKRPNI
jgi:hypothetical protein